MKDRITVAVSVVLACLLCAASAHAASSAKIGPFIADGDGEYVAKVVATIDPPEPDWPWNLIAYSVPAGQPCAVVPAATVFVSDSQTDFGDIQDEISLAPDNDQAQTICLYVNYRNEQTLLTQATFTPTPARNPARERVPTLTQGQAWGHVADVLDRRFSDSWSHRAGGWIKCGRINRTRMRCRVAWAIGDTSYYGLTRIWYGRDRSGQAVWFYSYRIRGLDEYCASVTHAGNCSHLYVQR